MLHVFTAIWRRHATLQHKSRSVCSVHSLSVHSRILATQAPAMPFIYLPPLLLFENNWSIVMSTPPCASTLTTPLLNFHTQCSRSTYILVLNTPLGICHVYWCGPNQFKRTLAQCSLFKMPTIILLIMSVINLRDLCTVTKQRGQLKMITTTTITIADIPQN